MYKVNLHTNFPPLVLPEIQLLLFSTATTTTKMVTTTTTKAQPTTPVTTLQPTIPATTGKTSSLLATRHV